MNIVAAVLVFFASPILDPIANDTVVIVALLVKANIYIKLWCTWIDTWI